MARAILQRIADGDKTAVQECLDTYSGLVWSLARRLIGFSDEAEDAVQEIFIDVWKNAARFDEAQASETTFIAMIARRRLIDRIRRIQRQPRIQRPVQRVEHARLALGDLRVAVSDEVVPKRQRPRAQRVGKIRLLRQKVRVNVAADQPAPEPQWAPEHQRQQHRSRGQGKLRESPACSRTDVRGSRRRGH